MSREQYEAAIQSLKNEMDTWRQGQSRPSGRFPERFWSSAAALVQHSSIEKVAAATGMSADGLKKRVFAATTRSRPASFVELLLPSANKMECVIKVETSTGARMQCEVGNLDAAGLAAVIREFAR